MRNGIGILALLWTGMLCAGMPWGFAGQPGIYSTLYNGGSENQQAKNCVRTILNTNPGNLTSLTAGSLTLRVCGATLQ